MGKSKELKGREKKDVMTFMASDWIVEFSRSSPHFIFQGELPHYGIGHDIPTGLFYTLPTSSS